MGDVIYRIQDIKPADDNEAGALTITAVPASAMADDAFPEVGDYLVIHKDNGPPEESE